MAERYFTVEQANALLPSIRPLVARMLAARERILAAQPDLWPVLEKAVGNGGSARAATVLADFNIVQATAKALEQLGVELKDVNTGLIDFPHRREGRVVYLCWRYDEPEIGFWHDLEAGFAGRQPL